MAGKSLKGSKKKAFAGEWQANRRYGKPAHVGA